MEFWNTISANKEISRIIYNHLNLPVEINFSNGKITYLYNAVGQKVKKVVNNTAETIKTDYLAGFQHHNDILKHFPHAEGYVNVINNNFKYVFNYTDHLGNIRLGWWIQVPNATWLVIYLVSKIVKFF